MTLSFAQLWSWECQKLGLVSPFSSPFWRASLSNQKCRARPVQSLPSTGWAHWLLPGLALLSHNPWPHSRCRLQSFLQVQKTWRWQAAEITGLASSLFLSPFEDRLVWQNGCSCGKEGNVRTVNYEERFNLLFPRSSAVLESGRPELVWGLIGSLLAMGSESLFSLSHILP